MFVSTGYVEDFHEDLVHYNIAPLYSKETTTVEGTSTEVYSSTHSQAINCQRLLNKQKQHYMFQLATPLTNIRSFLPSNIEYGFRLFFTEPNRFFTSGTACKPVYKIDECKLYVKCILFKEAILGRIERRLQSSPLVYPFLADFVKTYSVERGHTDATINLAIRSPFEIAYVMLFKNTDYIGNYKHNLYKFERHGLQRAFLTTQLDIKIPSLPYGSLGDTPGYDFSNEEAKLASYFYVLDTLGKIRPEGTDLHFDQFYNSSFILPFAISAEPTSNYSPELQERIMTRSIATNNRYDLYLKFATTTE